MSMDKELYLTIDINEKMADGHIKYLEPYLNTIKRRIDPNSVILEIGIGTGLCGIHFESVGYKHVFGVDIEPDIVKRFIEETAPKFRSNVQVKMADAFNLESVNRDLQNSISCIYHQGLLEHFSEEKVREMLDYHVRISRGYVIFAVPIEGHIGHGKYDKDEEHWSLSKWVKFLKRYVLFEYGVFGVDIDKHQAYFVITRRR